MLMGLPEVLEPKEFPRVASCYQATIPLDRFSRLVSSLRSSAGEVAIQLELSINTAKQAIIAGRIETQVVMQCQRCLEDYTTRLEKQFKFCILEDELSKPSDSNAEVLFIESGEKFTTLDLIEDEILFELPMVAVHTDIKDCDQTMIARTTEYKEEKRQNPFAILKNLKEPE